jgi:hypothetical protein
MLATEMPSRSDLPTDTTGGGTQYKTPTAKEITAGWQQAVKSGSYKVPTPKTQTKITQPVITPTSSKSTGNAWTNRRSNIIGQGINYPGRNIVEGMVSPFGRKGPITDFSPKGLAKAAGMEIAEAAFAVPASNIAGGALKAGSAAMKYGLKHLARLMPNLGKGDINKFGGVGKKPYGPSAPTGGSKPMLELGPGPAPAPSSVSSAASAGKSTAPSKTNLRLNKKGGYGGKPYGPEVPAATPAAATKSATTKTTTTKGSTKTTTTKGSTTRATTTKKSDPDAPKLARPEAEDDAAYALAQMKNRFPGMTEKDVPFIQSLNRAQQAIEKKSSGWQSYANWMKNPQTVATLRRLRSK